MSAGLPHPLGRCGNALWNLSRRIRHDETLNHAFIPRSPKELIEVLGQTPAGRAFLADFDAFLFEFGWRSDAVYDMADVTWREDPSIPLGALAGYIDLPDAENPEHHLARSIARREELMVAARVADCPRSRPGRRIRRYLEAASYNLPLTEDHASG